MLQSKMIKPRRMFKLILIFIFIFYLPNAHRCNTLGNQTDHIAGRRRPKPHSQQPHQSPAPPPITTGGNATPPTQVITSSVSHHNNNKCQLASAPLKHSSKRVNAIERRNLTLEPRDSQLAAEFTNGEDEQPQVASSNHSVHHQFEPPASAELVVEPMASPFDALHSRTQNQQRRPANDLAKQGQVVKHPSHTGRANFNVSHLAQRSNDMSLQQLGERWLPISQHRDGVGAPQMRPTLARLAWPHQQQQQQQQQPQSAFNNRLSDLASSLLAMRQNQDLAQMNLNSGPQRADLIEPSPQTANVQLANPLMSQYLYHMVHANQPTAMPPHGQHADLPNPSLARLAPQFAIAQGQMPLAATLSPNAAAWAARPARHLDIGEDGSSLVSYSLLPSAGVMGNPTASNDATAGLTQEQLMALLQQLGAQQAQVEQQSMANQLQAPPSAQNSLDSTMASLFENILKGAVNATQPHQQQQQQQHVQIQQPMTIVNNQQQQQQQPAQQQQYNNNVRFNSTTGPTTLVHDTARVTSQSNNQLIQPPQQPMQSTALVSTHQPHMAMGDQTAASAYYPQDAQLDPMYAAHPRRKPKKKRKKIDKADGGGGGRSPVVRVQKRPRQQFYEHNSPTDLEPSATFHKWKYPWLYRPPYDDDEDEEEGETEINLRFFNNFSRMGPLGPLARSAAPATLVISLAFLILSNISLAATVIVHGISSFLRNMSPQHQGLSGGVGQSPHKLTGRLARILFYETPQQSTTMKPTRYGTAAPTSATTTTTTTAMPPSRSGNSTIIRKQRATKFDRMIRSFSKAWV